MFGTSPYPFIIQMPSTPAPPPPSPGGPPPNPAEQIKQQIEGLTQLAAVFEEAGKKGKKDEKPKGANVDWKSLANLLFWTSPFTGLMMLHVYAALFTAMKEGVKPFLQ